MFIENFRINTALFLLDFTSCQQEYTADKESTSEFWHFWELYFLVLQEVFIEILLKISIKKHIRKSMKSQKFLS